MSIKPLCVLLLSAALAVTISQQISAAGVGESGPEFWVDGPLDVKPGGDPRTPDAAVDDRGRQVFVWDSDSTEVIQLAVFLRVFDIEGNSLVGPVQVNTHDEHNQLYPRLAIAPDNSFLVIWQSFEPPNPEDNFFRVIIRSQAYDSDGQPTGIEQVLSSVKTLIATDAGADVAALPGGGFVAVWESAKSVNINDSSHTIQGRRVGANGIPAGDQFQVNSRMDGNLETNPAVTALADGGFFVSWARPEIHGRRFMVNGTPVGGDFQINTYISFNSRDQTDVVLNDDGRVLVVWRDAEERVNKSEIRGRLYSNELAALGPDFRINTFIPDDQTRPKVGNYGELGFFVVWQSEGSVGPDVDWTSIEGRVVDGPDSFAGPQFLVNQYTLERQQNPGIAGMNSRVAIAWFSARNETTSENLITGQLWKVCGIFCDSFE